MPTTLTSPAISELKIESGLFTLFNEFLKRFFDGGSHAVGYNAPVVFPAAELRYQQAEHTSPLNGVGISMVWVAGSNIRYHWETVAAGPSATGRTLQRMAVMRANWMFMIRAQIVNSGTGNAKALAQQTGELLFAVLQNSAAVKPLGQKGIHRLRPDAPRLLSEGSGAKPGDPTYAMRLVTCAGTLRYPVISQPVN